MAKKRNIGAEILNGLRDLKRAVHGRVTNPSYAVRTVFSGFWRQFSAQVLKWQRDVRQSVL